MSPKIKAMGSIIAILIGIFTVLFGDNMIERMTGENPLIPRPSPTPDMSAPTWARSFERDFPPDFWSEGTHVYTLMIVCDTFLDSDDGRVTTTKTFHVSREEAVRQGPVYLRLGGLATGQIEGDWIDTIHPSQATVGVVTLLDRTLEEAELLPSDCNLTISWDDGLPHVLAEQAPFQP
jgi:hypothetical protein